MILKPLLAPIYRAARASWLLTQLEMRTDGRFRDPGMLSRGFISRRRTSYPFDRHPTELFLTDWETEARLGRVNSAEAKAILTNKLFFHYALDAAGLSDHAATLVGILADGIFHPHDGSPPLETRLASEALFVKPLSGHGGASASLVTDPDHIPRHGLFIVETPIQQHPYAAEIFPDALGTMRIVTMTDEEGSFIAGAAHKFATRRSVPVDNVSKGGILAGIDVRTGRLTAAIVDPDGDDPQRRSHHPDTGAPIEGTHVPRWEEIRDFALRLASGFPGIRFAGWDMCLSPERPMVVEGNASVPHPAMIQNHEPWLADPRVAAFMMRHGVVRGRHAARLRRRSLPKS